MEKICPTCGGTFTVPPSLERVICCSKECSVKRKSEGKLRRRDCVVCGKEFKPSHATSTTCSTVCAGKARTGVKRGNYSEHIEKTCAMCGKSFSVIPSLYQVECCSRECGYAYRSARRDEKAGAGVVLPAGGRPRTSPDTVRVCPTCSTEFTLPEWNKKKFCSTACAGVARRGELGSAPKGNIQKICAVCEKPFLVFPSQIRIVCCSRECMGKNRRFFSKMSVNQLNMTDAAWLAGLFEGEGSIIQTNRNRTDGGTVRITITNCHKPLLDHVRDLVGVGSLTVVELSKKNPRHQDSWTWQVSGAAALEILQQMLPWLWSRADRAIAALAGESFPRQSRWDSVYPEAATE